MSNQGAARKTKFVIGASCGIGAAAAGVFAAPGYKLGGPYMADATVHVGGGA